MDCAQGQRETWDCPRSPRSKASPALLQGGGRAVRAGGLPCLDPAAHFRASLFDQRAEVHLTAQRARPRFSATMPPPEPKRRKPDALPDSLPFVSVEAGQFVVGAAAADYLRSLGNRKLAVLALTGPYRTGKSFLLNRVLLERPPGAGFAVGGTVNACTKGLHLSTHTLRCSNSTDGEYDVLVLDSEGLGDIHASDTHDSRIFSLALLLASVFMYNSKGTIDQPALNQLSMVANISDLIRTQSGEGAGPASAGAGGEDLSALMPTFLWVVRDFHLELEDSDGKALTPDEYLEAAIAPVPGATVDRNQVRSSLCRHFRHRGCAVLPRPADDPQQLKRLSELPIATLSPAFLEAAASLRDRVRALARPKQACAGAAVTGPMLVRLAEIYCAAINAGAAPAIKDAWTLISADECRQAIAAALAAFAACLAQQGLDAQDDAPAVDQARLDSALTAGFDAASRAYQAAAVGEQKEAMRTELRSRLSQEAARLRTSNLAAVDRAAQAAAADLERDAADAGDLAALRRAVDQAEAAFRQRLGSGVETRAAWHAQVARHLWTWVQALVGRLEVRCASLSAQQAQVERLEQRVAAADKLAAVAEARHAEALEAARLDSDAARQLAADLEARGARLADELAERAAEDDALARQRQHEADAAHADREELAQAAAAAEANATALGVEVEGLRHACQQHEAACEAHAQAAKDRQAQAVALAQAEQAVREEQQALQAVQRKNADLTKALDEAAEDHRADIEQLRATSGNVIRDLTDARRAAEGRQRAAQQQAEQANAAHEQGQATADRRIATLEAEVADGARELAAQRAAAKEEVGDARREHAQATRQLQAQLETAASDHRAALRAVAQRTREEHDALFQAKTLAVSRAQAAEQKGAQSEALLQEARRALAQEREDAKAHNYAGRVSELETQATMSESRVEILAKSLQEKVDQLSEQQAVITDLETQLRNIHKRHASEIMHLELTRATHT